jgi:TatD DNase family protein
MLIDTHAHLFFDQFNDDRDDVIARAAATDVRKIINIATDLDTSRECIEMAEVHAGLFATVGIHPNDAGQFDDRTIPSLKQLCSHPKVVAIGEIGLDFYRDWCPPAVQEIVFRKQIRLAKEVGRPIVIHNREAGREIIDVIKSEGLDGLSGVFHCFSEDEHVAGEVLDLGFFISFTGNLTFKKSELPSVASMVPVDRLLLETDCPFLAPEPKRGRRNEPAYVHHICEKLAEIKGLGMSDLAGATTKNAHRLFGLGEEETM